MFYVLSYPKTVLNDYSLKPERECVLFTISAGGFHLKYNHFSSVVEGNGIKMVGVAAQSNKLLLS